MQRKPKDEVWKAVYLPLWTPGKTFLCCSNLALLLVLPQPGEAPSPPGPAAGVPVFWCSEIPLCSRWRAALFFLAQIKCISSDFFSTHKGNEHNLQRLHPALRIHRLEVLCLIILNLQHKNQAASGCSLLNVGRKGTWVLTHRAKGT